MTVIGQKLMSRHNQAQPNIVTLLCNASVRSDLEYYSFMWKVLQSDDRKVYQEFLRPLSRDDHESLLFL
jgi:hypothetical protein